MSTFNYRGYYHPVTGQRGISIITKRLRTQHRAGYIRRLDRIILVEAVGGVIKGLLG